MALGVLGIALLALVLLAAAVLKWSGVTLKPDAQALARVRTEAFAGRLVSATATTASGHAVPLTQRGGAITPSRSVAPGERIEVDATVERPGWLAWALGDRHVSRVQVTAPVARVRERWMTVPDGQAVRVAFSGPVARASAAVGSTTRRASGASSLSLGDQPAAGRARVRVAARSWERLGSAQEVTWFPRSARPSALVSPAPSSTLAPAEPIRLTFSKPVREVLGSKRPATGMAGRWRTTDSHTIAFTPSGAGAGLDTTVDLKLPRELAVSDATGGDLRTTREVKWTTPPGSTERLQQLLADANYLPLRWVPDGENVARTTSAEYRAAVDAPAGHFAWKWDDVPAELKRQWDEGSTNEITRGAIMKFQDEHHLTVDAVAGPALWKELIQESVKGTQHHGAYSYVYVHRDGSPATLHLWSAGHEVLTSLGNPGVPGAPTALGTYPVFEHLRETTMSGTNPDGSHYTDPGIKWVSYFNGGDALHAFNRASFGTPQSVGCIELPEAKAAKVWPYTPIGTLVTIEQ